MRNENDELPHSLHINTERSWRGGEQQTLYLVEGLARRGYPVTLVCQAGLPLHERARTLPIEIVPMRVHGELDPVAIVRLARLIRGRDIDIVHMHTPHAHTLGCAASVLARRGRCVVTRRVAFSTRRSILSGWKYRWNVDRYVAVSHAVKDVMVRDGIDADRITVVHSCTDPDRCRRAESVPVRAELHLDPTAPLIGNVAHLAPNKGHRHLIDAMPRILDTLPRAHLVIVGTGKIYEYLVARAAELDISRSVTFLGFRDDVPNVIKAFDVHVTASLMEGFPTTILDAMMCGVPVVATDTGGVAEMIVDGENGLLVSPGQPAALADAILNVLTDEALAARFVEAGRRTSCRDFSTDVMVEKNLDVYRQVMGRGQRASSAPS